MLFSSPFFLFVFLPLFLGLYGLLPGLRRSVLLAGSLGFYAWGEPRFIPVVLASAALDYALGQRLVRLPLDSPARRALVAVGVAANVGLLVAVKYSAFIVENVNALLILVALPPWPVPRFTVPLGLSFIVFEKVTYVVDLHRRVTPPARSFRDYLSYVFLFPKLLAGPIVKYHDLAAQLARPGSPRFEDVRDGLLRFVWGFSKKVLLADTLAPFVDQVFGRPANEVWTTTAWLGLVGFWLQLYFDFSGYSDMAIGLGRVLGFRLRENFNHPCLATSFGDFWKRWHISLGSWVRQYLFRPLCGRGRVSRARGAVNLGVCMVVVGLWHGAAWTFVVWGLYHGLALVLEATLWRPWQRRLPRAVNLAVTLLGVMVSCVFFRSDSVGHALRYLGAMAGHPGPAAQPVVLPPEVRVCLLAGLVLIFAPLLQRRSAAPSPPPAETAPPPPTHRVLALTFGLVLLLCCLGRIAVGTFHPFLYFRF